MPPVSSLDPMNLKLIFLTVIPLSASAATLSDSFRAAMSRTETIQQGEQKVVQADENVNQVVATVLPTIAFNASHTIQPLPNDPIAQQFSPRHQTTASVGFTQPIFRGFREFAGLDGAKHLRSAEQASQEKRVADLYQSVASTYLTVLSLEQDLQTLREQSDLYGSRINELGARVRRGESNETDVVTAQASESSLQAEIRLVQSQILTARENLRFLTGLPTTEKLVDPNLLAGNRLEPLDAYLKRIDERPDVKAARESFEASQNNVSIARSNHFPSLDAFGNYYFVRPGFLSDLKWDVGVRLTVPLFEGGGTQAKFRAAVSQRTEWELAWQRARRAAEEEIRSLHGGLLARLDHIKSLERSVALTEKNSNLLQRDYRRGLARNIDVQEALTALRTTRRSYDQSRFAGQTEFVQLQKAAALLPTTPKGN